MQFLFPLLMMLLMFFLNNYLRKRQQNPLYQNHKSWPYQTRDRLLAPEAARFFHALRDSLGAEFLIMAKVDIQGLVHAGDSAYSRQLKPALAGKYLDFVVCTAPDTKIICCIEFEDHNTTDKTLQEQADIANILAKANIPLLHYAAKYQYSEEDFRHILNLYRQMGK